MGPGSCTVTGSGAERTVRGGGAAPREAPEVVSIGASRRCGKVRSTTSIGGGAPRSGAASRGHRRRVRSGYPGLARGTRQKPGWGFREGTGQHLEPGRPRHQGPVRPRSAPRPRSADTPLQPRRAARLRLCGPWRLKRGLRASSGCRPEAAASHSGGRVLPSHGNHTEEDEEQDRDGAAPCRGAGLGAGDRGGSAAGGGLGRVRPLAAAPLQFPVFATQRALRPRTG